MARLYYLPNTFLIQPPHHRHENYLQHLFRANQYLQVGYKKFHLQSTNTLQRNEKPVNSRQFWYVPTVQTQKKFTTVSV